MKYKKLILFNIPLYLIMVLVSFSKSYAGPPSPLDCAGPSTDIKVEVKQNGTSPIYSYRVINQSTSPIRSIILGDSDQQEMLIRSFHIPASILAPDGWIGQYRFGEESEYMSVRWFTNDDTKVINPGSKLSGFEVTLSEPLEPINKFPFAVLFNGTACVWGRVNLAP